MGVSCDQNLIGGCGLFGRYAWQNGSIYEVNRDWSFGCQLSHRLFRRESVLGIAYGVAQLGQDWTIFSKAEGLQPQDERHLEVYGSVPVTRHLTLTPDAQWVSCPDGDACRKPVWVFGFRTQVSL